MVSIRDVSEITGLDQSVAREYAVSALDASSFCQYNAKVARAFGRTDHERLFRTLQALLWDAGESPDKLNTALQWHKNQLARSIIFSL